MKRKNLSKVLAITLCLTFALSTVAMAKTNKNTKITKLYSYSARLADPLPKDGEVPQ